MPRPPETTDRSVWSQHRRRSPDQEVPQGRLLVERFHSPPRSPSPRASPHPQRFRAYTITSPSSRRPHHAGSSHHDSNHYVRGDRRAGNQGREDSRASRNRAHLVSTTPVRQNSVSETSTVVEEYPISNVRPHPSAVTVTNIGTTYHVVPLRYRKAPCERCIPHLTTPHSEPCYHMQACSRCGRTVHPCRCSTCVGEVRQPRECPSCPGLKYCKVYVHCDRSVPTLN